MKSTSQQSASAERRLGSPWINFGYVVVIVAVALATLALFATRDRTESMPVAQTPARVEAQAPSTAPPPARFASPDPENPQISDNHPPTF